VYTVVVAGLSEIEPVVAPVFHVYVLAPMATNVPVELEHIVADTTEIAGNAFTVTVLTTELSQPLDPVPKTVYELFAIGVTTSLPLE
jgi:hypothetical protein